MWGLDSVHLVSQLTDIHLHGERTRYSAVDTFDRYNILVIPAMPKFDVTPAYFHVIGGIKTKPARAGNMRLHPGMQSLLEIGISSCKSPTK